MFPKGVFNLGIYPGGVFPPGTLNVPPVPGEGDAIIWEGRTVTAIEWAGRTVTVIEWEG